MKRGFGIRINSNQLTSEVRTGGNSYTQTFVYDDSGNRTKKTLGGTDTTYLYNTADQLTSETTGGVTTEYEYDANGALTKSDDSTTVNVYTYDYDGYLAAFDTTGTDNDATYTYDADKRRIAKTVDSTTIKYFLDGSNVIADFDGDDVLLATYVTPGLDANLSQERGGSTYYYMADGLGSIRNLVDSNEDAVNVYDYYAFGKELGSWTENVTNRYTYTAREYDTESGDYYYKARYYDGGGRFNRRDPREPHGYVYVSNDPVFYIDPHGLDKRWYPSGTMTDGPISWRFSFDATFHEDQCRLGFRVKVQLLPDGQSAEETVKRLMLPWARALQNQFNNWRLVSSRCCSICPNGIALTFRVKFDDGVSVTEDQEVNVYDATGRSNMRNWYLQDQVGLAVPSRLLNAPYHVPVHEMAHMFGVKDEYSGGGYGLRPEPPDCSESIMCRTTTGNILQRHVEQVVKVAEVDKHLPCPKYKVYPK